jgi:hypothetical protein
MPRAKKKPSRIPAPKGAIYVELPLDPEKKKYLEDTRKRLSDTCGCDLSLYSLLAALTEKGLVDEAAEALMPKLKEIQALQQAVTDAQEQLVSESNNLGVIVEK